MQMEKLFWYLIFFGCLSLIWGRQILRESLSLSTTEKEKKNNVTDSANKNYFPMERMDTGKLKDEALSFGFQERRIYQPHRQKNDKAKTRGLSAYEEPVSRTRKRNPPPFFLPPYLKKGYNIYRYAESAKKYLVPPHSQELFPAKNYNRKPFYNDVDTNNIRSPFFYKKNNSVVDQSHSGEASEIIKIFHSFPNEGRSPRSHFNKHNSKICNACNNSPWIPLIKVPHSYRQERNQHFEVHKPHLNVDLNPVPSISTSSFLLPPGPVLPPSTQFILDGTISSSFGLPAGNIPMSHGMLAPLNHLATKFNRYGANSIDYSNSLSYFPSQNFLNSNNAFPELSPIPVVPIHDSGQFQAPILFNTPITKILPPTTKTLAVSNVILTFSEGKPESSHVSNHGNSAIKSDPGAIIDLHPPPLQSVQQPSNHHEPPLPQSIPQSLNHPEHPPPQSIPQSLNHPKPPPSQSIPQSLNLEPPPHHQQLQSTNIDELEIIKSVPIAEFLSSDNHVSPPPSQHLSQNFQSSSYSQSSLLSDHNYNSYQNVESSEHSLSNNPIKDDPSNYLVPPPLDHFYNSSVNEIFPPYPPLNTENTFQGSLHASSSETKTLTSSPNTSWTFSEEQAINNPTAHPLLAESQAIASVVNSQLYPEISKPFQITSSEEQNFDGSKSKKIQIIIPYITKNKNEEDHKAVESVRYEVLRSPFDKSFHQTNKTNDLTFTTSTPLTSEIFSPKNATSKQQETFIHTLNPYNYRTIKTKDEKEKKEHPYVSETQHILASNVRQLLLNEVEKTKSDQNLSLQKNIDNWTALEYSNHKMYENKQPQKIITQALAVTAIPGISISHLLLPSKKIPSEYFATTPTSVYEDTQNFLYEIINSTVNSSPFTARPYATTNLYSPLTTVTKETTKDFYNPSESQSVTTLNYNTNHQQNYTILGKSRVSTWGKSNENSLEPSTRTSGRRLEETTLSVFTNKIPRGSINTEKVEVVTPVYWSNSKNFTTIPYRRTTRHLTTLRSSSTENPKTKNQRPVIFPFKSRLRTTLLKTVNSTKLEKVSKCDNFNETFSKNITKCDNKTEDVKQKNSGNLNKTVNETSNSFNISSVIVASNVLRNVSSEEVIKVLQTNKSEEFSINDIFPFRNQELPWESNGLNASNPSYQNERQRKSLIKQKKLGKPKTAT